MTNRLKSRLRRLEVEHQQLTNEDRVRAHEAFMNDGVWPHHPELRRQVLAYAKFFACRLTQVHPCRQALEIQNALLRFCDEGEELDHEYASATLKDLHAALLTIQSEPPLITYVEATEVMGKPYHGSGEYVVQPPRRSSRSLGWKEHPLED